MASFTANEKVSHLDKLLATLNKAAAMLAMAMFVAGGGLALFVLVYGN